MFFSQAKDMYRFPMKEKLAAANGTFRGFNTLSEARYVRLNTSS